VGSEEVSTTTEISIDSDVRKTPPRRMAKNKVSYSRFN